MKLCRPGHILSAGPWSLIVLLLFCQAASAAKPVDIVILTFEPQLASLLNAQLEAPAEAGGNATVKWTTGTVASDRYPQPYRLAVGLASTPGNQGARAAADDTLQHWQPRFVLLAATARELQGKLQPGDLMISRLIWQYGYANETLTYQQARSYRGSGAMITAASALPPGNHDNRGKLKAGGVATGNVADSHDSKLVTAILQRNPRTLYADEETAVIADAIATARDRGDITGFAAIAANSADEDRSLANTALSRFLGDLIRTGWPVRPR